jgi:hypothetical protein
MVKKYFPTTQHFEGGRKIATRFLMVNMKDQTLKETNN